MKKLITLLAGAAAIAGVYAAPAAAEYPERPVTFIVPWPPGDLEDQLTRLIAEEMIAETGVPAKVVNRPGGGAVEGATAVAQSDPDGYTVGSLVIDVPTMHIIQGNAAYGRADFEPVGIFLTYPFALVALKSAPYDNMAELAEYAKSNPVKLGHFGYDLVPTMATFVAAKELGFSYGSDAGFDMLDCGTLKNGDVDVMNTTMATVLSCLDDIKAIAAYTDQPLSILPDAKLLSEQVPGMNITLWNGLFVPKKSRDDHYHNPPDYIVLEPEDTTTRTRNLQQTNTNGYKFQGNDEQFAAAKDLVASWGSDGAVYHPSANYQQMLRQLLANYPYRLDTNYAKMDRIVHTELEDFKSRVLATKVNGMTVRQWARLIGGNDEKAQRVAFAHYLNVTEVDAESLRK